MSEKLIITNKNEGTLMAQVPEKRSVSELGNIFNNFELNCNQQLISDFSTLIKEGYMPLIVSNHQSHADGLAISMITSKIKVDGFNGFYLPIASSICSGDQGEEVRYLVEKLTPVCQQRGVNLIPVTREEDIKRYGIEDKNSDNLKKLISAHKDNFGIIFLPEGTLKGGRINENGIINGMVEVKEDNSFDGIVTRFLKDKTKFCVLPVSIDGSYRLFDPSTRSLCVPSQKTIVTAKEIYTHNDFMPTRFIMPKIASMLPPEAAGIYRIK